MFFDLPKNVAEDSSRYRRDGRSVRQRVHFFDTRGIKISDLDETTIAALTSQCSHPGEWVVRAEDGLVGERPRFDPSEQRYLVSDLWLIVERHSGPLRLAEIMYSLQNDPEPAIPESDLVDMRLGVAEEGVLLTVEGSKWLVPFDRSHSDFPHADFGVPTQITALERSARHHLFGSYRLGDGEQQEDADFDRLLGIEPIWVRCFSVLTGRRFGIALREAYPLEFPGDLLQQEFVEMAIAAVRRRPSAGQARKPKPSALNKYQPSPPETERRQYEGKEYQDAA